MDRYVAAKRSHPPCVDEAARAAEGSTAALYCFAQRPSVAAGRVEQAGCSCAYASLSEEHCLLTSLTINDATYDAVHLLSLLQQVLPGMKKPSGSGEGGKGAQTPWKPSDPQEWFWCAKRVAQFSRVEKFEIPQKDATDAKGSQFWFNLGGQLISIQAGTLYARYYGPVKTPPPTKTPAKVNLCEISYVGIYMKLLEDHGGALADAAAVGSLRNILKGQAAGAADKALALLASILFIAEVARNHTAFHTGLMGLDLIEKAVKISDASAFQYTMKNSICNPETVDALLRIKAGSDEKAPGMASETDAKPTGGGEAAVQAAGMGQMPMSHALSESGGAFNLEGGGGYRVGKTVHTVPDPMTQTRRKEATLLIRWLSEALKKKGGVTVSVGDSETKFGQAYNFGEEYFTGGGGLDMVHIVPLLNQRVSTFDCLL